MAASFCSFLPDGIHLGWLGGEQGVTKAEIRPARPNYGRKLAAKRRRCGIFGGANIYWRRMEIKVDFSRLWSMREATISKTQRCRGFSSPTKSSAGNFWGGIFLGADTENHAHKNGERGRANKLGRQAWQEQPRKPSATSVRWALPSPQYHLLTLLYSDTRQTMI